MINVIKQVRINVVPGSIDTFDLQKLIDPMLNKSTVENAKRLLVRLLVQDRNFSTSDFLTRENYIRFVICLQIKSEILHQLDGDWWMGGKKT